MFCHHCGSPLENDARFCPSCGGSVQAVPPTPAPPQAPVQTPPQTPPQAETPPPTQTPPPAKPRSKALPIIAVLAVVLCAAGFFLFRMISANQEYAASMSSGNAMMSVSNYTQAAQYYAEALARKPKSAEAALALAQTYFHLGQEDQARQTLDSVAVPESSPDYEAYQSLRTLSQLNPQIHGVDVSAFPLVTLQVSYQGDTAPTPDQFTVEEGDVSRGVQSVQAENGAALVTYEAEPTDESDQERTLVLTLRAGDTPISRSGSYVTPHFDPALVSLVSTDVSAYPTVRAYFRVTDSASGESVPDLTLRSFAIRERVQGGEYLVREVKSALPLAGNVGLNIGLVADKSDSISDTDMGKIKSVMTDFVNSLHYGVGDKAEVLAFDSIVQQMCHYTGDNALLVNGISSMSTDGMTAFYDAVHDGVEHAALQGGARCVIAFTDGMDNESRYSASEVIRYANASQVPVYIVGVGRSVEESTLRSMAQNTGGRYWFIDDLYDLQDVFETVYAQQKELYLVEYESDATLDQYLSRDLSVQVTGGGHRGEAALSFTPVPSIGGGQRHTSRYQLFQESLSWEDASRKCQQLGGHLATITSQAEMDELTRMADAAGLKYIWLGGYTSHDSYNAVFGHWVTGENFSYEAWAEGEPSRLDQDGTEEWYIMLWNIPKLGGWCWNDQRNDPAAAVPTMAKSMGYICEFEQ